MKWHKFIESPWLAVLLLILGIIGGYLVSTTVERKSQQITNNAGQLIETGVVGNITAYAMEPVDYYVNAEILASLPDSTEGVEYGDSTRVFIEKNYIILRTEDGHLRFISKNTYIKMDIVD